VNPSARLSLILLLAVGLLGASSAQGLDSTDYFPLHIADKWWLQSVGPFNYGIDSFTVTGRTTINDTTYHIIEGGNLSIGTGLFWKDSAGNVYKRLDGIDQMFYKVPGVWGDKWSIVSGGNTYEISIISPLGDLATPLGLLRNCRSFRYLQVGGGSDASIYLTLAPRFGLASFDNGPIGDKWMRLQKAVIAGIVITGTGNEDRSLPNSFQLHQNYPNPFNPSTTISYDLPTRSHVTLRIFNVLGQEVATLVDGEVEAGRHQARWNPAGFASGVYLYRLRANDFLETKKMLMVR
jgi:hypothetical protein